MPIGGLLAGIFGGDNGGGGQGQAQAAPQQQGALQGGDNNLAQNVQNIVVQVAYGNQQAFGRNDYNYVLRNEGDMVFREYVYGGMQQQYIQAAAPARHNPVEEGIQILGNDFAVEGLEFTEIVVPEHTYIKLRERIPMRQMFRFIAFDGQIHDEAPRELIIHTAMGPVKIVNEKDKKENFNLEKYMEVVENEVV